MTTLFKVPVNLDKGVNKGLSILPKPKLPSKWLCDPGKHDNDQWHRSEDILHFKFMIRSKWREDKVDMSANGSAGCQVWLPKLYS